MTQITPLLLKEGDEELPSLTTFIFITLSIAFPWSGTCDMTLPVVA